MDRMFSVFVIVLGVVWFSCFCFCLCVVVLCFELYRGQFFHTVACIRTCAAS